MKKPNHSCLNFGPHPVTRREMLARAGAGFGGLALAGLLGAEAQAKAAQDESASPTTKLLGTLQEQADDLLPGGRI